VSSFYDFHLLHGLPGFLIPLSLCRTACIRTLPSSILSTCSSNLVCIFLFCDLLKALPIFCSTSSFLIVSSHAHPLTDLRNRISAVSIFANELMSSKKKQKPVCFLNFRNIPLISCFIPQKLRKLS
jgi:hypothetical protein